jgi:dihydropteroate synthase
MDLIRSTLDLDARVHVIGVLNVTPDSFSDGNQFLTVEQAVRRALEIEAEGADILEIGGESTRPGAVPVSVDEELDRVIPVLEALRGRLRIPISIDTTKWDVADAAIERGAELINDVSGLRCDSRLADVAAATGAGLILMHSRGTPETMQTLPPVPDVFAEVKDSLATSLDEAMDCGVEWEKLILDPGIGFGKTPEQNLELIAGLGLLVEEFERPLLLGPSRKSFIPRTLDRLMGAALRDDARERRAGTAASVTAGILRGARLVRVHDVGELVALTRLTEEILRHTP